MAACRGDCYHSAGPIFLAHSAVAALPLRAHCCSLVPLGPIFAGHGGNWPAEPTSAPVGGGYGSFVGTTMLHLPGPERVARHTLPPSLPPRIRRLTTHRLTVQSNFMPSPGVLSFGYGCGFGCGIWLCCLPRRKCEHGPDGGPFAALASLYTTHLQSYSS